MIRLAGSASLTKLLGASTPAPADDHVRYDHRQRVLPDVKRRRQRGLRELMSWIKEAAP